MSLEINTGCLRKKKINQTVQEKKIHILAQEIYLRGYKKHFTKFLKIPLNNQTSPYEAT